MLYVKLYRYSTFCTELAIVAHITVSNSGSGIENQHLKVTNRQTTILQGSKSPDDKPPGNKRKYFNVFYLIAGDFGPN